MNPPDPIPAPVKMSEARARKVLLMIAAMNSLYVMRLVSLKYQPGLGDTVAYVGMVVMRGAIPTGPAWCWAAVDGRLRWIDPQFLGRTVVATGRIDRGLGAAK